MPASSSTTSSQPERASSARDIRVALIEDDPVMGQSIMDWFSVRGYRSQWFRAGGEALAQLPAWQPQIVISDVRLPDMTGEDVHTRLAPTLAVPFVFITGYGDVAQAVRLMRAGAIDYVTKPFEVEELLDKVEALVASRRDDIGTTSLGRSPAMLSVSRVLDRLAPLDSTVLLIGPSGSGKEVAARYLHSRGSRSGKPFLAVNCAAVPADLFESEMFGHERGAFTGARQRHAGFAERAADGCLFLDEVGELAIGLQAKLLRLIENRTFQPLGGERPLVFKARLFAATNADLARLVSEGRFREDLYHRLAVITVAMPPLAQRREDIVPLARRFLADFSAGSGRPLRGFSSLAERDLSAHDYPGNVRELRNRIERAVALCEGELVGSADLFPERAVAPSAVGSLPSLADSRDAAERRSIEDALAQTNGDATAAALLLGVSRSTIFEKIRRLGVRGAAR